MTTDTILHKYMRHLRYIDQGNIVHLDAVELALRCALDDLADWLGSATDHATTDENLIAAQGRRITELQADLERLQTATDTNNAALTDQIAQLDADNAALIRRNKELTDALRLVLIDLKNEDLVPFAALPHTDVLAANLPDAEEAIARLHDIKERRVRQRSRGERIVLVIDELAELARLKDPMRQLASILAIGRSKAINVIAATQKPLGAIVGSVAKANFTTRLVGRVMSGDDARVAAGVSGVGAEFLPGRGSFLRIEGMDVRRFQSYWIPDIDERMSATIDRWTTQLPIHHAWMVAEEQDNAHL